MFITKTCFKKIPHFFQKMFFLENMVAFKIRKAKALFKMMDCFMQGQSDLRYYYLKKRSSAGATAKLLFSSSIIQETIKSRLRGARPCYTSTVYSCVFYCSTRWGCVTTFTIAKLGRFFSHRITMFENYSKCRIWI